MACEEILVWSVCDLADFILVDSSTVISWTSPFVILGVSSFILSLFSSPEHEVLMVSYCDQSLSVVRRPCVVNFLL